MSKAVAIASKEKLNEVIGASLLARGISSFKLCSQLHIPHAQFAEAIKETNVFPRDERLFSILVELGIVHTPYVDESSFLALQSIYDVSFKRKYAGTRGRVEEMESLPEVLEGLENLPASIRKSIKQFSAEVAHIFSLFEGTDVFVYLSLNLLPFEMTPTEGIQSCARHIARAANDGAYFIYLFPSSKLLNTNIEAGCAVESYSFKKIFDDVFMPALLREASDTESIEKIKSHVLMVEVDSGPFFVADHKFVLYKVLRKTPARDRTFCMGLLPFGNQDNAYILPLHAVFMRRLSGFVSWQLQRMSREPGHQEYADALHQFCGI